MENIQTFNEVWRGIGIRITFERNWLSMKEPLTAHLQIESTTPARCEIPITETGYKSHFCPAEEIDRMGGSVAYVMAWLNAEAELPHWRDNAAARDQLSLF